MRTPKELAAQLHPVLDGLHVIIWVAGSALANLQVISPARGTLLGHPLDSLHGQLGLATLLLPKDWELLREACRTALRTHEVQRFEHRLLDSQQRVHWFRTEIHPLSEPVCQGCELAGVMIDVTEYHDTAERLRRAQQRYAEVIDSVEGVVWEVDPSTFTFLFISKAAERLLGYPTERWLEEQGFWQKHLHPEDQEWAMNFCRIRVAEGRDHDFEYRMIAANGSVVWIRDIVTVIIEAGKPSRLRGVMMDITPQKQAQQQLEQSLSLLQATLESSADAILAVDREGHITLFNQRLLEMWKVPEELVQPRNEEMLLAHAFTQLREPERFLARVRELQGSPEAESLDILELNDGRFFERYSKPQRIGGRVAGRVWSFRDITARLKAERERRQLLRQEQEARATAEAAWRVREDFLSIASHELKTPLTPLSLRLQRIEHALRRGERLELDWVQKAISHLSHLTALIDDLLDVSRIEAGQWQLKWQRVSLHTLVKKVVEEFELVSPQHRLVLERHGELTLEADPERLEQVVTNLVDNAIKYSPGGGIVHVQLEEHAGEAVLSVSDQGIGIPAEQQEKLFERFFRARNAPSRQYGGLGLGLYITRRIVEAHGGRIGVHSQQGEGSTFFVRLPLGAQDSCAKQLPAPSPASA